MSAMVAITPINAQTLGRVNWSMTVATQKAAKAQERAEKAVEAANAARKRAYDEMMSAGVTKHATASARTSTKSFAAKDPSHALAALGCVDLNGDVSKHDFSELGVVAYKYSVRTASEKMTQPTLAAPALYPSARASAMMAAKTVRYIYELVLELAVSQPERHAEARRVIEWHSPQSILKGRETRGAGIVMYSETALELVKTALATAMERVGKRVEAAAQYESEMQATAAAAAGVAAGDTEGI